MQTKEIRKHASGMPNVAWLSGFLGFTLSLSAAVPEITLETPGVRVSVDANSGTVTVTSPAAPSAKVPQMRVPGATGSKPKHPVTHPILGNGEALELTDAQGDTATVSVYPSLPFALVQRKIRDAEGPARDRVTVAAFEAAIGAGGKSVQTLGTGGLMPADKNPCSYAWLAVADAGSRAGVVAGWLTHERASGVISAKPDGAHVEIEARGEYGTLSARNLPKESEILALGCFADARLGLEAWADAVAKMDGIKLHPQPSGFCTWYADKHGKAGDEKSLAELSGFASNKLKPSGFSFVQIDDGWQLGNSKNGPNKNFTGHKPNGPFPSGMKSMAAKIKASGLTPGIWFMPFAGNWNDPWFEAHQDWFVKRKDGKPFDSNWSATCLDMSNPGAREYVRTYVSRISHDWGYGYFKMDGFHTGAGTSNIYVNAGYKADDMADAVFTDPTKTNIEVFRDGIRLVREAAGPDVFFLGCCVTQNMRSYEGSFGLLDAMRVGPDNSGSWKGWRGASPVFGSRHYFLNGRIWYNDPDPEYVRATVSQDEARTMATWTALSGQLHTNSDWIPGLPPERLQILRHTMAPHHGTARPVDLFDSQVPHIWLVTDTTTATRRDVAGFYNWDDEEKEMEVSPDRLGLPAASSYAVFDYWGDRFLRPLQGTFKTKLPPHASQVLAIRAMLDHPFLLSTSQHVTQGMTDVSEENWDAAGKVLSIRASVTPGEPYELRVVAPGKWTAARAETDTGLPVAMTQSGTGLRLRITPKDSGTVNWKVVFK